MERDELQALYEDALQELGELGEVWLEYRVMQRDSEHVEKAMREVERVSRKYERKLRKR